MSRRRLQRSPDTQLGGVCAGVAEYLDTDVTTVRIASVVMMLFTSAPIVLVYVLMWMFAGTRAADLDVTEEVEVQWDADRLRLSYPGAIAPFTVSWRDWLGGVVATTVGLAFLALLASVGTSLLMPYLVEALAAAAPALELTLTGFQFTGAMAEGLGLFALFAAGAGLVPRTYGVTVSHAALVVERPFRAVQRIDLADVASFDVTAKRMVLTLRSGEEIELPLPRDPIAVQALEEQLLPGQRRALAHHEDLDEAEDRRRELERVLASRTTEPR